MPRYEEQYAVRIPLRESAIRDLPEVTFSEELMNRFDRCAICIENFDLESNVTKLPCAHIFHPACIGRWLRVNGVCPFCRLRIRPKKNKGKNRLDPSILPPGVINPIHRIFRGLHH